MKDDWDTLDILPEVPADGIDDTLVVGASIMMGATETLDEVHDEEDEPIVDVEQEQRDNLLRELHACRERIVQLEARLEALEVVVEALRAGK